MPIEPVRAIFALGIATLISACAGTQSSVPYLGGPDNFGEANRQTMAAQIIDPQPVYDTALAESSGEHAAQAVARYRTNTVKRPDRVQTSTTEDVHERARDNGDPWGEADKKGK